MKKQTINFDDKNRLELSEIKNIEFEILKYFKKICVENNFRYFLTYGTLLGAVRHKGFIPWDDDIDVAMPRPDYDKLVNFFKNNDTKYRLVNNEIKKEFKNYFSKLVDNDYIAIEKNAYNNDGIFIDIFPIDAIGNSAEEVEKNYMKFFFCKRIIWYNALSKNFEPKNFFKNLLRFPFYLFAKIVGVKYYFKKYDKFINRNDYYKNKYKFVFACGSSVSHFYLDEEIGDGTLVEFEGEKFKTFSNYDLILKKIYGDYMKIPDEKDRITHNLTVYKIKN